MLGILRKIRVPNKLKAFGIAVVLLQTLFIEHEIIHQTIFKYHGVPSRIEMGFFWGKVIPEFIPSDVTISNSINLANAINEIVLPIEVLLVIIIVLWMYYMMEDGMLY